MDSGELLGTKVTWLDIERTMQKFMNTEAHFGTKKTITNIGDNRVRQPFHRVLKLKGFSSRIGLVEADWTPLSKNLPQNFVVKIMHGEETIKLTGKEDSPQEAEETRKIIDKAVRVLGNHEIDVYEILKRENPEGFLYPKVYGYKKSTKTDSNGFMILEFFEDVTPITAYENVRIANAHQVLTAMASFSSLSEKVPVRKDLYFFGFWKDLMKSKFFKVLMNEKIKARYPAEIRKFLGESHSELLDKYLPIVDKYYSNGKAMLNLLWLPYFLLKVKPVLVHNDLWSANIIWTKDGECEMKMRAVIDFAATSIGNPAADLSRFITICLSPADRRANTDKLIEEYYAAYLKALDGKAAPFSLDQLKELYKILFPMAAFFLSTGMLLLFEIIPADTIEKHRSAAIEKVVAAFEDFLVIHEELMIKYPKLYNTGKKQLISYTIPKIIYALGRYVIF